MIPTPDIFQELPLAEVEAVMVELAEGHVPEKTGEIVGEHLATGGKRLRARLALVAVKALGADVESAVPWAAACELLHNATLIHDDLQDGDELRRGRPTAWVRHGMPSAINAGDLLLVLPTLAVERVPRDFEVRWNLARALAFAATRVIRGQVAEFEMTRQGLVEETRYFEAIDGKTSPLFELAVEGAALITGRDRSDANALSRPFRSLGRLFQIQDDVLDLYGDKGRDQPGADIREGKISALVVVHLMHYPEETEALLELLRTPRQATPQREVDRTIARFRSSGTLDRVLRRMHHEADDARKRAAEVEQGRLAPLLDALVDRVLAPIRHL